MRSKQPFSCNNFWGSRNTSVTIPNINYLAIRLSVCPLLVVEDKQKLIPSAPLWRLAILAPLINVITYLYLLSEGQH